jgi:hypothetical protein
MFTGSFEDLKADLDMLLNLGWHEKGQEILVRRIEHTDLSQGELYNISEKSIKAYPECIAFLKENYPMVKFTVPYLSYEYRGGDNEYFIDADNRLDNITQLGKENKDKRIDVIIAESAFNYFSSRLKSAPNISTHFVKNKLYGGSVTVAGLLNHSDIKSQYFPNTKPDIIMLPYEMYDTENKEITGESIRVLENYFKACIWKI